MEELLGLSGVFSVLFACEILKVIYSKVVTNHFEDCSKDRKKDINLELLQRQYFDRGNNQRERSQ